MSRSHLLMFNPKDSLTAIDRLDHNNLSKIDAERLAEHTAELERQVRAQIEEAGGDSSELDAQLADIKELEQQVDNAAWAYRFVAMFMTREKPDGP